MLIPWGWRHRRRWRQVLSRMFSLTACRKYSLYCFWHATALYNVLSLHWKGEEGVLSAAWRRDRYVTRPDFNVDVMNRYELCNATTAVGEKSVKNEAAVALNVRACDWPMVASFSADTTLLKTSFEACAAPSDVRTRRTPHANNWPTDLIMN